MPPMKSRAPFGYSRKGVWPLYGNSEQKTYGTSSSRAFFVISALGGRALFPLEFEGALAVEKGYTLELHYSLVLRVKNHGNGSWNSF